MAINRKRTNVRSGDMKNMQSDVFLKVRRVFFRYENSDRLSKICAPPVVLELSDGSFFELLIRESLKIEDEFSIYLNTHCCSVSTEALECVEVSDNLAFVSTEIRFTLHDGVIDESQISLKWKYGVDKKLYIAVSEAYPLWFEIEFN